MFVVNSQNTIWIILFIEYLNSAVFILKSILVASRKNSGTNLVLKTTKFFMRKSNDIEQIDSSVGIYFYKKYLSFVLMSSFKTIDTIVPFCDYNCILAFLFDW